MLFAKRLNSKEVLQQPRKANIIAQHNSEAVKVIVRCRPFVEMERRRNEHSVVSFDKD